MTPPYSTSARLRNYLLPRTDGLGQDRNGRAKVLLSVVVVVVLVVLVGTHPPLHELKSSHAGVAIWHFFALDATKCRTPV